MDLDEYRLSIESLFQRPEGSLSSYLSAQYPLSQHPVIGREENSVRAVAAHIVYSIRESGDGGRGVMTREWLSSPALRHKSQEELREGDQRFHP